MNLTNKQLIKIIKEEIHNTLKEREQKNSDLDALKKEIKTNVEFAKMFDALAKISRKEDKRREAFGMFFALEQRYNDFLMGKETKNAQTGRNIAAGLKYRKSPSYKLIKAIMKITREGNLRMDTAKKFVEIFLPLKDHAFMTEKSQEKDQSNQKPQKTADTDRLLDVIDSVNDEWDSIANSTKDGKLKSAMDYMEKIALAELKKK